MDNFSAPEMRDSPIEIPDHIVREMKRLQADKAALLEALEQLVQNDTDDAYGHKLTYPSEATIDKARAAIAQASGDKS